MAEKCYECSRDAVVACFSPGTFQERVPYCEEHGRAHSKAKVCAGTLFKIVPPVPAAREEER